MNMSLLVWLVDDSPDFQQLMQTMVERYCSTCRLRVFSSGSALLEEVSLADEKPRLLVLDQHMPQMDGLHTLLALKRQTAYQSIPAILISSDASASEIRRFLEAGGRCFMKKPLDTDGFKELFELIRQQATA